MISKYPEFSKLKLEHAQFITSFTAMFEPYSDFNFVSLFSWNINESTEIAMLNDNLVVKMPDYIDGNTIFTIIGKTNINQSLSTLLDDGCTLKLIPQTVIGHIEEPVEFQIISDDDNHDYLYDLKDHANLDSPRFRGKRKKIKRFIKEYGSRTLIRRVEDHNESKRRELENVFREWAHGRKKDITDIQNENKAIIRILENASQFELETYEILIDEKIVGFSINEILSDGYANCHFQKCLLNYANIDVFLTNFVANKLLEDGCSYSNWEQDLGVEGLKELKKSYHPVKMLEKYQVI
jgi:uncharacterized protein